MTNTIKTNLTPIVSLTGSHVYFNAEKGNYNVATLKAGFRLYNDNKQYIDFPTTDTYEIGTLAVARVVVHCKLGKIVILCGTRQRRETLLRKLRSKLTQLEQKAS